MAQRERAVVKLREWILSGELTAGERVPEIPVAERLGVSRTPVRQALTILAQEGLLSSAGKRGYLVREFQAKDIRDGIEVRGILEGAAARLLAESGPDPELVKALDDCIIEGAPIAAASGYCMVDDQHWSEINGRFHRLIVEGAGNQALIRALALNNKLPFASATAVLGGESSARQLQLRHLDVVVHAQAQHRLIRDAIVARQGARAEALMREHALLAQENLSIFREAWAEGEESPPPH